MELLCRESDLESDSDTASINVCLQVVVIAVLISFATTVIIAAILPNLRCPNTIEMSLS